MTLRTELAEARRALAARPRAGRRPNAPGTPDARLVERACKAGGWTRVELAAQLAVNATLLSKANSPRGLSVALREALRALVARLESNS